jgi:putative peptide zinc metalloprotease protein
MKFHALALIASAALLLAGCEQAASPPGPSAAFAEEKPGPDPASGHPAASANPSSSARPAASGASTSASPAASASPNGSGSAAAIPPDLQALFSIDTGGGPANIVRVINQTDGKVRSEGRMQGKTIPGNNIRPANQAFAYASCTNCQTYAVALQIVTYRQSANVVAPANVALAINYHCTGCNTVARALQYVIPTDDPDKLPPSVQRLARQVSREVGSIQSTPTSRPPTPTRA